MAQNLSGHTGSTGWVSCHPPGGPGRTFQNSSSWNFAHSPILSQLPLENILAMPITNAAGQSGTNTNAEHFQTRHTQFGHREMLCPDCGEWIGLGRGRSDYSFQEHRNSKICRANIKRRDRKAREAERGILRFTNEASQAGPVERPTSSSQAYPLEGVHETNHVSEFRSEPPQDNRMEIDDRLMESDSLRERNSNDHNEMDMDCPGVPLKWDIGSLYRTFPLASLDSDTAKFHLTHVSRDGQSFRIRAKNCTGHGTPGGHGCFRCQDVNEEVIKMRDRNEAPSPHTQHVNLGFSQLVNRLQKQKAELGKEQMKNLNLGRRLGVALNRVNDSARLGMLIATNKVVGLSRLLRTALNEKVSVTEIIHRIERAIKGEYHARAYGSDDMDLAILTYRLGGTKLLYALNHAIGLPSVSTMRQQLQKITLTPSIGSIKTADIMKNIAAMFGGERAASESTAGESELCGHTFALDEISIEERPCYMKRENKVGGLCREHSKMVDLTIHDVHSLADIADNTCGPNPTVHYGKEATVGVIGPFREKNAGVWPVLVSPTCKSEDKVETGKMIDLVLRCWKQSPDGERRWGPIWSCASDGDATRRAAFYDSLMKKPLDETGELYEKLGNGKLPGLNLYTGENEVTMDFDYKHLFKRACTLLCSEDGMLVNDLHVNRVRLREFMLLLDDHTPESVDQLLKPHDTQDVPRAIELLQTIHRLKELPKSSLNPSQLNAFSSICLLGDLFHSLTQPFVNPKLTLSQQVEHLSQYAHIAFALYYKHSTSFASNQFYGDSQAMVKNAIFVIAKHQIMCPSKPLYLVQLGDDRLEQLFGRVRMLGGHYPNCDFKTLSERLGAALGITDIFLRHPSWDAGSRRLSMKRAQNLDHLKPVLWKGNVTSSTARLQPDWKTGRERAIASLNSDGVEFDFLSLFASGNVDLMRPFGGTNYPGVSTAPDRSTSLPVSTNVSDSSSPSCQTGSPCNTPILATPPSTSSKTNDEDDSDDESENENREEPEDLPYINLSDLLEDSDSSPLPPAMQLSAATSLSNPVGSPALTTESGDWLEFEGKWYHKASLVRCMFEVGTRKSFERVDRVKSILGVRTFTSGIKDLDPNSDNITGVSTFAVDDLFAALIKTANTTALGVFQCSSIVRSGTRVHRVSEGELGLQTSNIKLTGQLLDMYATQISFEVAGSAPSQEPILKTEDGWAWTGGFVQLLPVNTKVTKSSTAAQKTQKVSKKTLLVPFPSFLVSPLNFSIHNTSILRPEHPFRKKGITSTWIIGHEMLEALSASLWRAAQSNKWIGKIPACGPSAGELFPYRNDDISHLSFRTPMFTIEDVNTPNDDIPPCRVCGKKIKARERRAHMSAHILRAQCHVAELGIKDSVANIQPCGFCGRESTEGRCAVTITIGKAPHATSTCSLAVDYKYGQALKGSDATPCTNVPVLCKLCQLPSKINGSTPIPAIWRYNYRQHIHVHHPGTPFETLQPDILDVMQVSEWECRKLLIPQEQIPPPIVSIRSLSSSAIGKRKRAPEPSSAHSLPPSSRRRA